MSSVFERYRVLDRIGAGGIGVVYQVEDKSSGEVVAMKIMPRARGAANLRSEFLALARLEHPNIVRVFDYGLTESGHDFFTMEYVAGPPLLEAVGDAPTPAFYQLVGGLLGALTVLHSRGIVHADIKPSNILVDGAALAAEPARAARLVDFGLAAVQSDPMSSAARGTFPYAAPEVYAGHLDARSDLYALGVVLYEMLTGVQPFRGPTVREVLQAQRRGLPADPRTHRSEIPAALAELVLALIDPAPGARPQSADEVLARINDIAGTDFAVTDSRPLVDLSGVLVGRDRDLGALQERWRAANSGRGGAVLLCGEEGIGKTRLLEELKLAAQLDGGHVHAVDATARAEAPYAGISELIRGMLAALGARSDSSGEWRRTLAPLIGGTAPQLDVDHASRFALAEAVTAVVLELAAFEPVLVMVDNVDRADAATVEVLAYLARSVGDSATLIVLAGRDSALEGTRDALAPIDSSIRNAERGLRVDLPPLDRGSIYRLCEQAFGTEIARGMAAELHRSSGGNPAHAAGALELMVASGAILRERGRWHLPDPTFAIPLPPDARTSALARADLLGAEARAALDAAAVLGNPFTRDAVAGVLDQYVGAVDEALGEAARARLLEADATTGIFRFCHAGVAESLHDRLAPDRRDALHARAAEVLERARAARTPVAPGALARHYLIIGDRERAVRWGLEAAEAHARTYDHHGALEWYLRVRPLVEDADTGAVVDERLGDLNAIVGDAGRALECYDSAYAARAEHPAAHIRLARRIGELRRRIGDGEAAVEVLMAALDEARQHKLGNEEAACHLRVGWVLMYRGDYKAANEHAVAGLLIARAGGDRATSAELERLRASVDIYRGETRSALAHLEAGLADAAGVGDDLLMAGLLHTVGNAAIHEGDYPRAIDALEKAIPVSESAGNIEQAAKSLNNLGAAYYYQGDWQNAREAWERFRRLCERLDEHSELVRALNNLGSLYLVMGQFAEALAVLDRAGSLAELTSHHHSAMVLGNRGEVMFRQGDLAAARECYRRALSEFQRLDAREDIIETRRRMSELDIACGKLNEALERAIDCARAAKDAGARLEEGILHRVIAEAVRQQGDLQSAAWFLEKARSILTQLGARYERGKLDFEAAELALAQGKQEEAERSLDAAIETFVALGARWDLDRARARKRACAPTARMPSSATAADLDLLLELSQAAANVEVERLLELALDKVLARTEFERGFILLLDKDSRPRERLRRVRAGSQGFGRDDAEFSGTIVRKVAASGKAVAVSDIAEEADLREQKSVVALGLRQIMCVPMRAHGRVIGIIYIDSRRLSFEDHGVDLSLLEAYAAQVALAVENARLLVEEKRKGELMAILAHEIRNPLAGILGYSDMGENDLDEDHDIKATELFGRIRRDAERLKRLVDNVLELARHEAGNIDWSMAPFDMAELVGEVATTYTPACEGRKIELAIDTTGLNGPALGNPDRIVQVLSNLVGNAIKFTTGGGRITIAARRESVAASDPQAPPMAATEIRAWTPTDPGDDFTQDFVRVDVLDTGPGMTEDIRERLFQKFSQGGKTGRGGVGLGLYISREIVARHGGTIWVESEPGKGSAFSFRVPVA